MNWPLFFLLLGVLLGFLCLAGAMRLAWRKHLIDCLPTSKTTGVFIGFVEVNGSAESAYPLYSHLASIPCVYYSWGVEEHWKRTVTETYTDSKGKQCTRTREEEGWARVAGGGSEQPFYLRDDCGEILIRPDGADVEPVGVFYKTCDRDNPLYFEKGPPDSVPDSEHRRRFGESAIPLHAALCIFGQAREREDIVAAEIAADARAPMFLISTRTKEQISRGYSGTVGILWVLGLLLGVAGFLARDLLLDIDPAQRWPFYLLPATVYLLAAVIGWFWMIFNSLIDLRQRVLRAGSLVEIELRRRHDLIPNIVAAVTGMRDHEFHLQPRLATLRARQDWTVNPAPLAVAEAYPGLKSHQGFLHLHQSLTETEDRIALARRYLNEITMHYNTRLQTIPEQYVAAAAGMKHIRVLIFATAG